MKRIGISVIVILALTLGIVSLSSCRSDQANIGKILTLTMTPATSVSPTHDQMSAAESIVKNRLSLLGTKGEKVQTDYTANTVTVRIPWESNAANLLDRSEASSPETASQLTSEQVGALLEPVLKYLGGINQLTFREGNDIDQTTGQPAGITASNIILTDSDVVSATPNIQVDQATGGTINVVSIKLNASGTQKLADATARLAGTGYISIWIDQTEISAPKVNDEITDGNAVISGNLTAVTAQNLACKINGGVLPFAFTASYRLN